jgi:tRNA(Ile)-lysidine synthase
MALLPEISPGDVAGPVLIGFSGGLDSTVLLHWLKSEEKSGVGVHFPGGEKRTPTPLSLRALHVHHGLHGDADAWSRHCQEVCAQFEVPCEAVRVRVANDSGFGLEASARAARYAAFAAHLRAGETLALAHHRDDQAETVLLRLLRAAGSDGLAAMRSERPFAGGRIWRPFLSVPRAHLLAYAQMHGLRWIDDPSNEDEALDRNFLRKQVVPQLHERWPQASAALARSAAWLEEDAQLLQEEAQRRLAAAQGLDPATLSLTDLLALPHPWRRRVLRAWLAALGKPPLPGHAFAEIECSLLRAAADAEPEYRWAGQVLRRWRGLLHVETARPALPDEWQSQWDGTRPLPLPTGDALAFVGATLVANSSPDQTIADKAAPTTAVEFLVTARRGGERITLPGRTHSHSLKHVLQDLGVPPWQRERLPLLSTDDNELLAAGDLAISARFEHWLREHGLRLVWRQIGDRAD